MAVGFPAPTLARYPGGMSLLWREAGALLMLVHLAATDLHLGSCLVGTCGVLYPIGPSPRHPVDLGAVVIGTSDVAAGWRRRNVSCCTEPGDPAGQRCDPRLPKCLRRTPISRRAPSAVRIVQSAADSVSST